jgi:hypothetical protein
MTRTVNLFNQISSLSLGVLESVVASRARMTRRIASLSPFTCPRQSKHTRPHQCCVRVRRASIEWRAEREHNYSAIVWTGDDTMELSKQSEYVLCCYCDKAGCARRAFVLARRVCGSFRLSAARTSLQMKGAFYWLEMPIVPYGCARSNPGNQMRDARDPFLSSCLLEFGDFSLLMSAH